MKVKDTALTARQIKAGPLDGLEEGTFTAYASVFGNVDSYGDVIVKGAFANDLKRWSESGNPIPLLFGHNMTDPDYNIGHVLEATEDDHGLLVKATLDLDNPKAAQVYRMLKGRRVNQMSFAYDVIDASEVVEDGESHYELRELKVYEVSIVTIGANQDTEILAVKSAAKALAARVGRAASVKDASLLAEMGERIQGIISDLTDLSDTITDVIEEDDEAAKGGDSDITDTTDSSEASEGDDAKTDEPDQAKVEEPSDSTPVAPLAAKARLYAIQ